MPWRNGRGSTLEIAREPATEGEFAWRLSLADIERDGEFSAYPGCSRALVLVAGSALHLRFRGHGQAFLDPARPATRFEGEWKTSCAVPEGRCTDLSLIVRKGPLSHPASVVRSPSVLSLRSARRVRISRDLWGALFVSGGSVAVSESTGARKRSLRARDTLLVSPGQGRNLMLHNVGRSAARLLILRWRPGRPGERRPARVP